MPPLQFLMQLLLQVLLVLFMLLALVSCLIVSINLDAIVEIFILFLELFDNITFAVL